jgi:4-alpha-glucanotransferase
MNNDSRPMSLPPFPSGYRASGVLVHITSLPSRYGIGEMGPGRWRGSTASTKQVKPGGKRRRLAHGVWRFTLSPCPSPNGPDELDWLIEDGRCGSDCEPAVPAAAVDYGAVIEFKHGLLETLWARFSSRARPDLKVAFEQFCHQHAHWLDDYALFRALKARHNNAYYLEWPADLVQREPAALVRARQDLASVVDSIRLAQFLLFHQAQRLKEYAHAKGVRLIGDLPFFVSPDSSDVWANSEFFLLDDSAGHVSCRCATGPLQF